MNVTRFRRPRSPFKPHLEGGDHYVMYVMPLLLDVERAAGRKIDSMRLVGGRWQALLASTQSWVFTDELLSGKHNHEALLALPVS